MSGIFGSYSFLGEPVSETVAVAMSQSILHRGPDADGYYSDQSVLIGNRRLSILDLTESSNQPMYSDDRDVVLVQNGEIYNYIELRERLLKLGAKFTSKGDTEVLLRAFEQWGSDFVLELNGMFAIAIYRKSTKDLFLYRDRLGVKPCYLAGSAEEGRIWFGSEIKAILANGKTYKPNIDAIAQYFALNYIPQPHTAFEGIQHLPPAHMVYISASKGVTLKKYWDLADVSPEPSMTEADAKAGLIRLLDDATRLRLRSDVPFGAFLSGGLDSSTVVGFMSMYQHESVRTFSIGFDDQRFDATQYALLASRRFGAKHEVSISDYETSELWSRLIWQCDQPHGDISFIPTDQISAVASKKVKMVLTGDGGDELFGGYERYLSLFPEGDGTSLSDGWEDRFAHSSGWLISNESNVLLTGELFEAFHDNDPFASLSNAIRKVPHQDPINKVLYADTTTLLSGNNLVKLDRMSMANSLETRSPFLDYRMAEFAFNIPGKHKIKNGETKWIYKKAVEPLLGRELTWGKKRMFTAPVSEWLRQSMTSFCCNILLDGSLESRNIISTSAVSAMLNEHISGQFNYTRQLRALISLEFWFRLFVDQDTVWLKKAQNGIKG
ncbi:MAG: asparagine synthase (glutamine-hydrolyzing) [Alphaproteobacteria bacterium]|nr:asparagine synthase (glutamine-hydrolyzing) [Alphaproteobacteria bacterium]